MTVWTLILAAGGATRFGGPKALAAWQGGTLLARAMATARAVGAARFLVVTGAYAEQVAPLAGGYDVYNADWQQGLGTSLAAGTRAAMERAPGLSCLVVLPVDMPLVTPAHLKKLRDAACAAEKCVLSEDGGTSGPPAAIPARFFPHLRALGGDRGLKALLAADDIATVPAPGLLHDIDTPDDLARLAARAGR